MRWMTAAEALALLGVRPQTLYANVSRRRIRARPDPKDPRRSLYHEADVQRLARRRPGARRVARIAAEAIEWGDPVLPSAICTVAQGRLWYRGQDGVALAETWTLEQVAALLWQGDEVTLAPKPHAPAAPARTRSRTRITPAGSFLPSMFAAMAGRAGQDPPSCARSPSALRSEAAGLLADLAAVLLGSSTRGGPLHERLAVAWRCREAVDVLRRALVLLADHELNASTFAVRVTVSTGASLAAGVLTGLATLSGPLHGGAAAGVPALIRAGRQAGMRAAVRDCLMQGRALSGFGHPLYPDGDVRAQALLDALALPAQYEALRAAVDELTGERPNIDFALAVMTACYRLPPEAPLALFALARSAGWLAHAMEQAAAGHLIRPRARYSGPALPAA